MSISPLKMLAVAAGVILLGTATIPAHANFVGEQWYLPIDHTQDGSFTVLAGAGYNGTDALEHSGSAGDIARVYWEFNASDIDPTPQLYTIQWFNPATGGQDWQPIESQFEGSAGEPFPIDPNIPWAGAFGTNHEYIGASGSNAGAFLMAGPGPHTPESAAYNAGANGSYMWLKQNSWLYAKWDFGWTINHAWSYLLITQITPEPGSLLALGAGLLSMGGLFLRRRSA